MTGTSFLLTTGHDGVPPSLADFSGNPSFDTQLHGNPGSQPGSVEFFDRDHLVVEGETRGAALALSEERLRFTQKAGRIGSWTLDLVSMELIASDGCKANFGRDPRATRPDGLAQTIAGISLDITDRKGVEEHRDLLGRGRARRRTAPDCLPARP